MKSFENNGFFWQKLDTLYLSSNMVIHCPKHTHHKKYTHLIYPVDFGYLKDPISSEKAPVYVFKGSNATNIVEAVAISVDILSKECEIKLLIGCNSEETHDILCFLNQTEFQKAIVVHRGNEVPDWAQN